MNLNLEPIRNWFGFTRRERRSTFILLLIILIIIAIRYIVPGRSVAIEDVSAGFSGIDATEKIFSRDKPYSEKLFNFNPNTASYDTLIKLGLDTKEANTLIRYREKGGIFRKPADIRKVYGINEAQAVILVPFVELNINTSEKSGTNSFQKKNALIDLNNCDTTSLDRLPGIGAVLSKRIIKYRHFLGGFARIDQLKEVYGLSEETYKLIQGRVYADSSVVIRININSADFKVLSRLPYFEKYDVTSILKYRELQGRINSLMELVDNKLITKEKAYKAGPYLSFD